MRSLTSEHTLGIGDLVWPLFFTAEDSASAPIPSLEGVYRYGKKQLWQRCEEACELGINAVALFAVVDPAEKDDLASIATHPEGFVAQTIEALKSDFPDLGVIADVALDPYTPHGHDGIMASDGHILGDATVRVLCEQAKVLAAAGADVIAPSDMMDGRVGKIREALDKTGHQDTIILSYAAKYASSLYGPFRDAVQSPLGSEGSAKQTYQLPVDRLKEALREVALDLKEGADMVMVKPAGFYGDVVYAVSSTFGVPTFVYHVSGEYAMLKAAARSGYIVEKDVVIETMISLKRAGAHAIITYYADRLARWLKDS